MNAVPSPRLFAIVLSLALGALMPAAVLAGPTTADSPRDLATSPDAETAAADSTKLVFPFLYARQLTYPANALSHSGGADFQSNVRGVEWLGSGGMMSLTVRRPKDYLGGRVRVTLFYEVDSDESGTIRFIVTPVAFNSGNSFETYGSIGTPPIPAPETLNALLSSSAVIEPGADGVGSLGAAWWYMDIVRLGESSGGFPGKLRIMAVSLEY